MRNQQIIDRLKKKPAQMEAVVDQESMEKKLWVEVYAAIAGAVGVNKSDTCVNWANKAVERFKERWPR